MAASSTDRANGPIWSRLDAKAISPYRLTRPYVGFIPTTPHSAAGWRMEPPVSVPSEMMASPAATAAALPPELPPGTRSRSQGLWVGKYPEFSVELPIANSSQFVTPSITAPASNRRLTAVAVYGGLKPRRICDPAVVSTPRTHNTSFTA